MYSLRANQRLCLDIEAKRDGCDHLLECHICTKVVKAGGIVFSTEEKSQNPEHY